MKIEDPVIGIHPVSGIELRQSDIDSWCNCHNFPVQTCDDCLFVKQLLKNNIMKYEWSEERHLWEMVADILDNHGDMVDNIHICETEGDYEGEMSFKVYCSEGYCFEISKKIADKCAINNKWNEGKWNYTFCEPWDGFKEAKYDGAVEVLSGVCGLKRK